MGLKKLVDKFKKNTKESLEKDENPKEKNKKRVQNAERLAKFATNAMKWYKKGEDTVEEGKRKAIDIAEKASPYAEKVDKTASDVADKAKKGAKLVGDKASELAGKAGKKLSDSANAAFDEANKRTEKLADHVEKKRKESEHLPSSGSSLIDLLSPTIPETDATKSKKKPPQPPKKKPPQPGAGA